MNRIRLLHEQVANQIAAGEVVERPASVVKELVENALDAQSTSILVEIQAGGRSLIRVTDDGIGMNRDDALLSLERHATSKIEKAEDLTSISTMGFRGEALPSIASVSHFSLTTRERGTAGAEGTRITVRGGRILEVQSAGQAPGTSVEVRQLFANLPARRKFLRSEETERAHILHYLTLAALAFPEVAFTVLHDGQVVWQLPGLKSASPDELPTRALHDRLRALLGAGLTLLPVDYSVSLADHYQPGDESNETQDSNSRSRLRIQGFIGAPGVSRATRQDQHLFVNRRPVENRALNHALIEGYHTALMRGRFPVCCLFLELNPADVDVNVHPAKREVRFRHDRAVHRLVSEAVQQSLLAFHHRSTDTAPEPRSTAECRTAEQIPVSSHPTSSAVDPVGRDEHVRPTPSKPFEQAGLFPGAIRTLPSPRSEENSSLDRPEQAAPKTASAEMVIDRRGVAPTGPASPPAPLLAVPLRLVGVIGRLYVLLESDRGLALMDQHAAHERVLFEQMLSRLQQGDAPSQRLLLAQTVELTPRDAAFVREQLGVLGRLGVGLSEFGERTFLLDALPPFVKAPDAHRFVLDLIDDLFATGQQVNSLRLGEQVVAKTVCRHAVKANDALSHPELENLLADLRRCQMPYTCPHGRPTLIEISYRDLERKFGRAS